MISEEQETVIQYRRVDDFLTIWTSDPTVMTKLDKQEEWVLTKTEKADNKVYAKEYRAPKRLLSFRSKLIKRDLTEEQKKVAAERMKKYNAARVAK